MARKRTTATGATATESPTSADGPFVVSKWYVVARVSEAGHVRVIGDTDRTTLYYDFFRDQWERNSTYATEYDSRKEAEAAGFKLVFDRPRYLGKLRIRCIRRIWTPCPPRPNA